jgi:hypothetical protein
MVTVTAYPCAGKKKSFEICLAFVRGCGGQIGTSHRPGGAAVFYGIDSSNAAVWKAVRASGQDFFYVDNSVFDSARQTQFRVTKNRLQHTGLGISDGKRFRALGVEIKPWRTAGEHIVVCPQSAPFMRTVANYEGGDWTANMLARLRAETTREIRLRSWSPDKGKSAATLGQDLISAHALVTWSSAAAVTAVLAGVPVLVESQDCVARPMSGQDIGALPTPDRENWAGILADNEWSLDEMRKGIAWQHLQN